jgi:hypothetical protein
MAGVTLRSAEWYPGDVRQSYIHQAWMRRGVPDDAFDRHLTEVAAAVRDGVHAAGGTPVVLRVSP